MLLPPLAKFYLHHAARPRMAAPGRCHCPEFVLCTPEGLASTLLRLPNVSSPASPWYAYLRTVYHSPPPLPITLRGRLELLYPALLPAPVCLPSSFSPRKRRALPLCEAAVCAEWMPDPPAPPDLVANYAANGSFIMAAALNESDRRPFGHAVVLQPPIATRRTSNALRGWVEVVRQAPQCPEGWSDSGCWFHQAKGSGVWVSTTDRSLILSARGGLFDDGRRISSWEPLASWEPWEKACTLRTRPPPQDPAHRHPSLFPTVAQDRKLLKFAQDRQIGSVQKLAGVQLPFGDMSPTRPRKTVPSMELAIGTPSCMLQKEPLTSSCVPIETRTGWEHEVPCQCDTNGPIINCEGSSQARGSHRTSAKGKLLLSERDRRGFATRTSFNRSSCSLDVSAYVRAVYPLMRVGPNRAAELGRLLRLFLFYYLPAAPGRSEGCTQREADGTATQYGADEDTRESCSGFHQCAAMVASAPTPAWTARTHVEVQHWSYATLWNPIPGADGQRSGLWSGFLDPSRSEAGQIVDSAKVAAQPADLRAWWYVHAPGSGIFLELGKRLVAPSKASLLARLLHEIQKVPLGSEEYVGWTNAVDRFLASRVRAAGGIWSFLGKLDAVSNGSTTCSAVGLTECYPGTNVLQDQYDGSICRLGRVMHYDTLVLTRSFNRPSSTDHQAVRIETRAEILDLKINRTEHVAVKEAKDVWTNRLSLRDPDDLTRSAACEFGFKASARPPSILACKNHPISWDHRYLEPINDARAYLAAITPSLTQ